MQACDLNNDGYATFDLTENDDEILNGLNPTTHVVSYFETLELANSNTFSILSPDSYTNLNTGTQTVYVRLTNILTGSYAITSFQISAITVPMAGTPSPLVVIDDNTDGISTVDLTAAQGSVLNGMSPQVGQVTYHHTAAEALSGEGDIEQPQAYATASTTLYFRLEKVGTACFDTGKLEIVVLPYGYVTPPPIIVTPQDFTEGETVEDIEVIGENILWYLTAEGGEPDFQNNLLTDGATYYATQTLYGIESTERAMVTIALIDLPDAPTGAAIQYFSLGETVADLEVTGENIKWYQDDYYDFDDEPLAPTTLLDNSIIYYATQTVNGWESFQRFAVMAYQITPPPVAAPLQTLPEGSIIGDIVIQGEEIMWYTTQNGDIYMVDDDPVENGVTYYATQTINNVESSARVAVTITFTGTPAAPTGDPVQYFFESHTIQSLTAVGQDIQWYSEASGGIPLQGSTLLVHAATYYATQTVNGLESITRLAVSAHITSPPSKHY